MPIEAVGLHGIGRYRPRTNFATARPAPEGSCFLVGTVRDPLSVSRGRPAHPHAARDRRQAYLLVAHGASTTAGTNPFTRPPRVCYTAKGACIRTPVAQRSSSP